MPRARAVQPPFNLVASAATSKQVKLAWKSNDSSTTGYVVERKYLAGEYTTLATVTPTAATDAGIDSYQTYVYRVRATDSSGNVSMPSNEITVGPPPVGFSMAARMPANYSTPGNFGGSVRMALDANGDPAFAWLFWDPSDKNDDTNTALYFTRWSRAQYAWQTPVKVAVTGAVDSSEPWLPVAVAHDASNDMFGIAYEDATNSDGQQRLDLALSTDGGATWKTQTFQTENSVHEPALAMAGGNVYLAFLHDFEGIRYLTGNETAAAATWPSKLVPVPAGATQPPLGYFRLALDSSGSPGLAFMALGTGSSDYNVAVLFWRPTMAAPVKLFDSNGYQNDGPDVALSFFGTNPRVVAYLTRDDASDYDHVIWVSRSSDGGNTWSAPVNVPSDHSRSLNGVLGIANDSQGSAAVIMETNGGQGDDGHECDEPKLSRSGDFVHWKTCGLNPVDNPSFSAAAPSIVFGGNDKLLVSFQNTNTDTNAPALTAGVILWREAPNPPATGPQISPGGIVNAASYTAAVSPGSLASIFGSNFAAASTNAGSVPLPISLEGVSVAVNGRAAPMFFVGAGQINFQVPYETPVGTAQVAVTANGISTPQAPMKVTQAAPGILMFGTNRSVATNQDGSINTSSNPARAGSYITVYMTGQGPLDNAVPTGYAAPGSPLSDITLGVTASIGGTAAPVTFAGLAPYFVGLMQVNIQIPDVPPGDYPLIVTEGGVASNHPVISVSR